MGIFLNIYKNAPKIKKHDTGPCGHTGYIQVFKTIASHCTLIGRIDVYENANAADRISPD